MYIKNLQLLNFRNYKRLNLDFSSNTNVFIGDNAQGKTNILESIYYCSIAKSHRTNADKELINWNAEDAYINAYVHKERIDKRIEIKIFKEGKKGIRVNSIKIRKISEILGIFDAIMFSPEDLKIVKGPPSNRRKLLDIDISQLDSKYYYNLVQYNKVLNERNSLLKNFYEKDNGMLDVYDRQLSTYGGFIIQKRKDYLNKLNEKAKKIHSEITNGKENIELKYITPVKNTDNIKQGLYKILKDSRKSDTERRTTLNGPHRDDFSFYINGINVRNFGSQGQQRTCVLTIKFALLQIVKERNGEFPVLLLDDVLSELDSKRQEYILKSINDIQTIITCTGMENIKKYLNKNDAIYQVKDGLVNKLSL